MPNRLILINKETAEKRKSALKNFLPFIQELHRVLISMEIALNEQEMLSFIRIVEQNVTDNMDTSSVRIQHAGNSDQALNQIKTLKNKVFPEAIERFLKEKLVRDSGSVSVGSGLKLNKDKLIDLVDLPDITELTQLLTDNKLAKYREYKLNIGFGKEGDYIQLGKKNYYIIDNAEALIDSDCSIRTKTSKGDQLLEKLEAICSELNSFDTRYGEIALDLSNISANTPIVKSPKGEYIPHHRYISAWEIK